MSGVEIALGSVALMLVLIYAGLHVAIALILTALYLPLFEMAT